MAHYPGTLESANIEEFGIVYADQIQGHKTVPNLESLFTISDAILSKSKNNTDNDAIGQEWYVVSEGCNYILSNWDNRKNNLGWEKEKSDTSEIEINLGSHGVDKIKDVTTTDSSVSINYSTWRSTTLVEDGSVTIPAATDTNAGVLTANSKDQLNQLNKIERITRFNKNRPGGLLKISKTGITICYDDINVTEGSVEEIVEDNFITLPAATKTTAGLATAEDKIKLDETIPGYTVNSFKISENPVISGGDILLTGYSGDVDNQDDLNPVETDTVNQGLSKINRSIENVKDNISWFEGN